MEEHEVVFCIYKPKEKELTLVNKIKDAFLKLAPENTIVKIIDLYSYEYTPEDKTYILFGSIAQSTIGDSVSDSWNLPSLSSILEGKGKETAWKMLQEIAELLTEHKDSPQHLCVETTQGITVGTTACDINITEDEAIHLKRIKELLGGGKMIITKGNLKIEVE